MESSYWQDVRNAKAIADRAQEQRLTAALKYIKDYNEKTAVGQIVTQIPVTVKPVVKVKT